MKKDRIMDNLLSRHPYLCSLLMFVIMPIALLLAIFAAIVLILLPVSILAGWL